MPATTGASQAAVDPRPARLRRTAHLRYPQLHRALRYLRRGLLGLAILVGLLPIVGFSYETIVGAYDTWRYPPAGRLVAVDGHQMHLSCSGEGRPTVIMDSGLGGWSLDWSFVQPPVAAFTRVCTYDRAGMGWSQPASDPRDAQHAVQELHGLLAQAGPGPFVLVGHSNDGLRVLLYASTYPDEVAGLVLVDPTPIASDDEGVKTLSPSEQAELQTFAQAMEGDSAGGGLDIYALMSRLRPFGVPRLLAGTFLQQSAYGHVGAEVRPAYLATFNKSSFLSTFIAERDQRQNSIEQVRRMRPLGDVPLSVLASSRFTAFYDDPPPPNLPERLLELSQKMLWELEVAMSRLSPRGTIQRVSQSGHYILIDRPDVVIEAVRRTVELRRAS